MGQTIGTERKVGRLFELLSTTPSSIIAAIATDIDVYQWHLRLGHASSEKLRTLVSIGVVPFSNQMDVRSEEDRSLARPVFMKRSRHQYSHQYCRRGSTSQANASTSHENRVKTVLEERPAFKLAAQCNSEFSDHIESIESTFWGPERIRYNSLGKDAISSHGMRMVCGICQKLMRRKLCFLGNTLSSSELPVAAVLVCGHVYHAECLENRSNVEDRSDPPCPLCMEPLPKADDSKGEEQE